MSRKKYDEELIGNLWQKYAYVTARGYLSDRQAIMRDYKEKTGVELKAGTLNHYVTALDKEKLFKQKHASTFNERTDNFIDKETEPFSETDLLLAIGLDPMEFELMPHGRKAGTINHWWLDKGSILERIRNGQVKIDFQKKEYKVTADSIAKAIDNINIAPREIKYSKIKGKGMLSIFLTDLHFWFMKYKHYAAHQAEILDVLDMFDKEETVLTIGSDLFHVDNSAGPTTSGTQVAFEASLLEMYEDAFKFYIPIIDKAIETSERVKIIFIEGNHDRTTSFGFVYALFKMYPQIEFDLSEKTRKAHAYKDVLLIYAHGDLPKSVEKMHDAILSEFRKEMLAATTVEVQLGHLHHRWSREKAGTIFRGFSSPKEDDKYHYDNGFIGAKKLMQLYYYSDKVMKQKINIDGYYYVGKID